MAFGSGSVVFRDVLCHFSIASRFSIGFHASVLTLHRFAQTKTKTNETQQIKPQKPKPNLQYTHTPKPCFPGTLTLVLSFVFIVLCSLPTTGSLFCLLPFFFCHNKA